MPGLLVQRLSSSSSSLLSLQSASSPFCHHLCMYAQHAIVIHVWKYFIKLAKGWNKLHNVKFWNSEDEIIAGVQQGLWPKLLRWHAGVWMRFFIFLKDCTLLSNFYFSRIFLHDFTLKNPRWLSSHQQCHKEPRSRASKASKRNIFNKSKISVLFFCGWNLIKQARKLQDAQAEKLTS